MIKWAMTKVYRGFNDVYKTGHIFAYKDKSIALVNLNEDEYPPFECVSLKREGAIRLRDFIDWCLISYGDEE